MRDHNIILIGPGAAGKSTLAPLLAARLDIPALDLDKLRWGYMADIGYDDARARRIRREQGFSALAAHWKPYDIHSVKRVLQDYPQGHVIAFGAGHSIYTGGYLKQAQQVLAGHTVILLLPTPDSDKNRVIFKRRLRASNPELTEESVEEISAENARYVDHLSNFALATMMHYTEGKSPAQSADEIYAQL